MIGNQRMGRRRFLKTAGVAAAALPMAAWPAGGQTLDPAPAQPAAGTPRRIAHLTDVHLQPELDGEAGFVACLHHMQENAKPDLVLFGGDQLFDVADCDAARRDQLSALWQRVLRSELSLPHRAAIGNHDIPEMKKLVEAGADPDAAKSWPCELLGLERRYYGFDQSSWRILVLDSVAIGGRHGYAGRIDEAQFEWLSRELAAAADRPVMILSHIPIVSVVGFFDGDRTSGGDWDVPSSYVHIDANRLHELFVSARNVRLCLSGHAHQFDRCLFDGITYGCHGAVCGNWWKGTYKHTPAGYATIDLFADGNFDIHYTDYGWQARSA